jgi:diguanylate cyclase (GGDEF)-like protein
MNQTVNYLISNETTTEYTNGISSLIEKSNDCLCITDVLGIICRCSFEFAQKFGYADPNNLIGSNISKIIDFSDNFKKEKIVLDSNEFSNRLFIGKANNHKQFPLIMTKRIIANYDIQNSNFIFFISTNADENQFDHYESKYSLVKSVFLSLSTILFSKLNLDELLNEILNQAGRVISFDSASISLLEDNYFNVVAAKGFENPKSVIGLKFAKTINDGVPSPNLLSLQNRKSYRLGDVINEYPAFVNPPGITIRSWMVIPLLSKEYGIGTLNLDSYSNDAFSAEDQYIGELFAAQVSVAIENSIKFMESEKNAKIDSLTGLLTRRQMLQLSNNEIEVFDPINHPISIIIFDIDNFKEINDSKGHLVGDQILKSVADLCMVKMRQNDIFSRFGGDEFIVIMPDSKLEDGKLLADRLCQTISTQDFEIFGSKIRITASFGVTNFLSEDTLDCAIIRADKALYSAKQAGRNRVVLN